MAAAVGTVRADLVANTANFSRGMKTAGMQVKGFSNRTQMASVAVGSFVSNLATIAFRRVIRGFREAADAANEFNQAMQSSLAIMPDVSDRMRKKMEQASFAVARATKFSAKEASQAYYFLASAGLDAERSIAALPAVAKFAQAGMFDLSRATDLLTDAQSALGLDSNNAAQHLANMIGISDQLVKANQLSNASVEQFADALTNKAAKSGQFLGMTLSETMAVLAVFAKQGRKGAEAGTTFAIVMRELSNKAQENAAAFEAAGVAVYDANKNFRPIVDIFHDLDKALMGLSVGEKVAKMAMMGFTQKSIEAVKLVLGMTGATKDFEKALRKAAGATKEVAEKQWTEFGKAMNKVRATLEQFVVVIVGPVMEGLGKLINWFAELSPLIKKVAAGVAGFALGWGAIILLVPAIVKAFTLIRIALKAMALTSTQAQAAMGPAGWASIAAGIVVAAGAVYLTTEAMDSIAQEAEAATAAVGGIGKTMPAIGNTMAAAAETASEGWKGFGDTIKKLEADINAFWMSARQRERYMLRMKGATAEQLAKIKELHDELDRLDKQKEVKEKLQRGMKQDREALGLVRRGTQAAYQAVHSQEAKSQLAELRTQTGLLGAIRRGVDNLKDDKTEEEVYTL